MADILKTTRKIKEEAVRLGFSHCGISEAGFLEQEAPHLEKWLKKGMHGEMSYMENYFDKRLDPTKLVEGSKSVISLLLNIILPLNNFMVIVQRYPSMHMEKIIM